ncbi:MAG: hypothetical protein DRJ51_06045 [Thermoprotei archaeon]|nr:MAG: hypothetical protein DRJ51_06045 [Thermoprotei archaeon]RLF01590.1 MAG: hypothetical protein DRJ59_05760 [Thermoprotei archaeon]
MPFMGILKRRLDRGEERVLKLTLKHLETCTRSVLALHEAMIALFEENKGEFEEKLGVVHTSEEEGDMLRRELVGELAGGILPPLSREDFIRLVERADMIADWARESARILEIPDVQKNICHHKNLCDVLKDIMNKIEACVKTLDEAVRKSVTDFKACLNLLHQVEEIEEEVDMLYVKGLTVLCNADKIWAPHLFLLERLLENLENLCDSCEDVGDVLKVIIVRALR